MFSQFLGHYLVQNDLITAEQFSSCMDYIRQNRVKLGLIAETEGLLTRAQANELNQLQMQTDKRFGDLAVEKGYLTETDVKYLLGRQGNPYLIFVQALEENNFLTRDEINDAIQNFKTANGLADETVQAIQNGDIEKMLPAFVDVDNDKYIALIGWTLRNIVDGFLGFTCDDDSILTIAENFGKEKFAKVDEDALDSVCEFTNCVNGLYATELSYQDITIDMLPPEFYFDGTVKDKGDFFVLPLYINGSKTNLIVKLT